MTDYRFTVYHVGVHRDDVLEPERVELERVGARQIVIPQLNTDDEMVEQTRGADALIVMASPVSRRLMESLGSCKAVLRTGVGVDTVDVGAATELGIVVINVPDLWAREVANQALGLLLACNRKLLVQDRSMRSGGWMRTIPAPVGSIYGETLGIVGLGRIGRQMARRAAVLELDIIASDPYIEESVFEEYGAEPVSLEELLRRSDYVSVHCPLTPETRHMFDEAAFRKMKSTACLVNTARGPVVDESALIRALQEGWIASAGIDVFEQEPPPADSPLLQFDNVVLTSHSAYFSDPALMAMATRCGREIARVLTGRMPMHMVNPEVLDKVSLTAE